MIFKKTKLQGLYSIRLEPVTDDRGFFIRLFCVNDFFPLKKNIVFTQINQSLTKDKGAVRGMHFQYPPYSETRIVRCIAGEVFDVAIDLRKNSKTFLRWHGERLSAGNMKMLYIPEGFAHGFQTLTDNCEMLYFHTGFYNKRHEGGIRHDDPMINIKWKVPVTHLSGRDKKHSFIDKAFKGIGV